MYTKKKEQEQQEEGGVRSQATHRKIAHLRPLGTNLDAFLSIGQRLFRLAHVHQSCTAVAEVNMIPL